MMTPREIADPDFSENVTVIAGTHRREDLIPAFATELEYRLKDANDEWTDLCAYETQTNLEEVGARLREVRRQMERSDFYDSAESTDALEWLFDALDVCAPKGYCFGAHEGDGADFGFWQIDD
jgi:hypothetical protein